MAERDLSEMLARMSRAKVNRRSFLATSGLLGTSAFLAACSTGGGGSAAPAVPDLPAILIGMSTRL